MNRKVGDGKYINVGGRRPVIEALSGSWPVTRIFVRGSSDKVLREIAETAKKRKVEVLILDAAGFDKKFTKGNQGVVAQVKDVPFTNPDSVLSSLSPQKAPLIVALDGIEDPQNMGAITRTALAMGVDALVVPRRRVASFGEGAAKASSGAIFRQPICQVPNMHWFINWAKSKNMWVYGLDMSGQDSIWETDMSGPLALIVGAEGKGLSHLTRQKCDFLVRIPMDGSMGSLNASVACGMALGEIKRQRLLGGR